MHQTAARMAFGFGGPGMAEDLDKTLYAYAARYVAMQLVYVGATEGDDPQGHALALDLAERGGNVEEVRHLLQELRPRNPRDRT